MTTCPTHEELAEFVAGDVNGSVSFSIADHLAVCSACRARADEAQDDADWLERMRRGIRPTDAPASVASGKTKPIVHDTGEPVDGIALSPDESLFAIRHGHLVAMHELPNGVRVKYLLGHTRQIQSVAFTGNGEGIVSGGTDGAVKTWSVHAESGPLRLIGHRKSVVALAFNPTGTILATESQDCVARHPVCDG